MVAGAQTLARRSHNDRVTSHRSMCASWRRAGSRQSRRQRKPALPASPRRRHRSRPIADLPRQDEKADCRQLVRQRHACRGINGFTSTMTLSLLPHSAASRERAPRSFAVPCCSRCGPFAVPCAKNSREQTRTPDPEAPVFSPLRQYPRRDHAGRIKRSQSKPDHRHSGHRGCRQVSGLLAIRPRLCN